MRRGGQPRQPILCDAQPFQFAAQDHFAPSPAFFGIDGDEDFSHGDDGGVVFIADGQAVQFVAVKEAAAELFESDAEVLHSRQIFLRAERDDVGGKRSPPDRKGGQPDQQRNQRQEYLGNEKPTKSLFAVPLLWKRFFAFYRVDDHQPHFSNAPVNVRGIF